MQDSHNNLAAVFEGLTKRIYGRTFAVRTLPAYQRSLAERSQPWLPSTHPVTSLDSPAFPLPAASIHSYFLYFFFLPPSLQSSRVSRQPRGQICEALQNLHPEEQQVSNMDDDVPFPRLSCTPDSFNCITGPWFQKQIEK
jgi:hypothetical protein